MLLIRLSIVAFGVLLGVSHSVVAQMRFYDTRYYQLHTDVGEDDVAEVVQRMTRMAEEYNLRTSAFAGTINRKFRFDLFRRPVDYYAAGGMPGSAGVYIGGRSPRLMAIAGEQLTPQTWHVIQHEGFHQFADQVMGGQRPPWLNEGIAEYFGESIFTGDGFVSGILPPARVARVQQAIKNHQFPPLQRLMLMTLPQWNAGLSLQNYDMSWTIFHFLAHGDDDIYQQPFERFMHGIGRGMHWEDAWLEQFGPIGDFEEKWRAYWLGLDAKTAGRESYQQAALAGYTSYLARANLSGERFDSFDQLVEAVKQGSIDMGRDPLPPSLAEYVKTWLGDDDLEVLIENGPRNTQRLLARVSQEQVAVGTWQPRGRVVGSVSVQLDPLPIILDQVRELIAAEEKVEARRVLSQAIREHSRSPFITEARQMMIQTR